MDSLQRLAKKSGVLLSQKKLILATAESCTGGLIAAALTETPGASEWFSYGVVSYSNEAKKQILQVPQKILQKHGAVSEATAAKMCQGLAHCDVALSVTGVAGPAAGTTQKPVGTVCFGWQIKNNPPQTTTKLFNGDRQTIRQKSAIFSLTHLIKLVRTDSANAIAAKKKKAILQ